MQKPDAALNLDVDREAGVIPISKAASALAALLKRARERRQPIIVTQKGHPAGILLDIETYIALRERALGGSARRKEPPLPEGAERQVEAGVRPVRGGGSVDQRAPGHPQDPSTGITHHISISPNGMRPLLDAAARLGVAYGAADEQIIAEDTLNGHQLQVSLRQDVGSWTMIVRGTPPLDAIISLHAESYSLHTEFSAAGEAQFTALPEAWLRTKIDLVVVLPAAASP